MSRFVQGKTCCFLSPGLLERTAGPGTSGGLGGSLGVEMLIGETICENLFVNLTLELLGWRFRDVYNLYTPLLGGVWF